MHIAGQAKHRIFVVSVYTIPKFDSLDMNENLQSCFSDTDFGTVKKKNGGEFNNAFEVTVPSSTATCTLHTQR